jgi:hypothetical protein
MFRGCSSLPEELFNDWELTARAYRNLAAIKVLHYPLCVGCPHASTCASQPVACLPPINRLRFILGPQMAPSGC